MGEMVDLEVGRFALRTFVFVNGRPESILSYGNWRDGTCTARCRANTVAWNFLLGPDFALPESDHESPAMECSCGIYGSLSLSHLREHYTQASDIVAVIAAEGRTIIGTRGLRTERARVVAYWLRLNAKPAFAGLPSWAVEWLYPTASVKSFSNVVRQGFPDAKCYDDLLKMVSDYGLSMGPIRDGVYTSNRDYWTQ